MLLLLKLGFFTYFSICKAYPYANEASQLSKTNANGLQLWLTISAQKRFIEVSWINAPAAQGDNILLTREQPQSFELMELQQYVPLAPLDNMEGSGYVPIEGYTTSTARSQFMPVEEGSGGFGSGDNAIAVPRIQKYCVSNNGPKDIVAAIKPGVNAQWFTTGVPFDYALSRNVSYNTSCYGYWVSYINAKGDILASNCIRAYPRWMHELSDSVEGLRLRDLLIPGTHDTGSFRPNFDPLLSETIVTKYALTQDDDVKGQLLHGARYLDLRVAYYKHLPKQFYINHGITRHRSLEEVIDQIIEFVRETDEIVIVGLKEFPVGFGKTLKVHHLLVEYLIERLGNLIVDPAVTWHATLRDIWSRKQNVILAYDLDEIVNQYPKVLFQSVQQRWGNVRTWTGLEQYLRQVNEYDVSRFSSRPVADMAELTPETWDVIGDTLGGLRKMADNVNWRVSNLYHNELGEKANIVAVDFMRGTNLMDLAMNVNKRKILAKQSRK